MNDIIFNDCQYRYANSNMKLVKRNQKLHDHDSSLLIGEVNDDVVKEVNEPSYIETHEKVLPLMHIFQSTLYKYFELIFMKRKSRY